MSWNNERLQALVEKMLANNESESDIKLVIEELTSKSPLKQDVSGEENVSEATSDISVSDVDDDDETEKKSTDSSFVPEITIGETEDKKKEECLAKNVHRDKWCWEWRTKECVVCEEEEKEEKDEVYCPGAEKDPPTHEVVDGVCKRLELAIEDYKYPPIEKACPGSISEPPTHRAVYTVHGIDCYPLTGDGSEDFDLNKEIAEALGYDYMKSTFDDKLIEITDLIDNRGHLITANPKKYFELCRQIMSDGFANEQEKQAFAVYLSENGLMFKQGVGFVKMTRDEDMTDEQYLHQSNIIPEVRVVEEEMTLTEQFLQIAKIIPGSPGEKDAEEILKTWIPELEKKLKEINPETSRDAIIDKYFFNGEGSWEDIREAVKNNTLMIGEDHGHLSSEQTHKQLEGMHHGIKTYYQEVDDFINGAAKEHGWTEKQKELFLQLLNDPDNFTLNFVPNDMITSVISARKQDFLHDYIRNADFEGMAETGKPYLDSYAIALTVYMQRSLGTELYATKFMYESLRNGGRDEELWNRFCLMMAKNIADIWLRGKNIKKHIKKGKVIFSHQKNLPKNVTKEKINQKMMNGGCEYGMIKLNGKAYFAFYVDEFDIDALVKRDYNSGTQPCSFDYTCKDKAKYCQVALVKVEGGGVLGETALYERKALGWLNKIDQLSFAPQKVPMLSHVQEAFEGNRNRDSAPYLISAKHRLMGYYVKDGELMMRDERVSTGYATDLFADISWMFDQEFTITDIRDVSTTLTIEHVEDLKTQSVRLQLDMQEYLDRTENFVTNHAPVLAEVEKITKELTELVNNPRDLTEVDLVYMEGLIKKLDELEDDYDKAVIEQGRLLHMKPALDQRKEDIEKNIEFFEQSAEAMTVFAKDFRQLNKTLANIVSMGSDILTAIGMIIGQGEKMAKLNGELREYFQENFAQQVEWDDDVSFWTWFAGFAAESTPNALALLLSLIPGYGSIISTITFMTWVTGGEFTTRTMAKEYALENKKALKEEIKRAEKEGNWAKADYLKRLLAADDKILNKSTANDYIMSIIYGGITGVAERFGTLKVVKGWLTPIRGANKTIANRIRTIAGMSLKGTGIEITEEILDQLAKNISDKVNGEDKPGGIFHGLDENFFANVVAFSTLMNGMGATRHIYQAVRQNVMTTQEMNAINKKIDRIDEINEKLNEDKRNPKNINVKDRTDLKEEKAKLLEELAIIEYNIIQKMDGMDKEVVKRIFELARKRDNVLKRALEIGMEGKVDKDAQKEIDDLQRQHRELQEEIDNIFEEHSKKQNQKEQELVEGLPPEIQVERLHLLGLYQASMSVATQSRNAAGGSPIIKIKGATLDAEQENKIRKVLKTRGKSDNYIEKVISDIKNNMLGGKMQGQTNAMEKGGEMFVFEDIILARILNPKSDYYDAADAAVAALHELFHIKHKNIGLVKDNEIREDAKEAVEELKLLMVEKLNKGKISQSTYEHFLKRIERYEGLINNKIKQRDEAIKNKEKKSVINKLNNEIKQLQNTNTEELLNIVADMMNYGVIQSSNFNQLFSVQLFMNSLVRKVFPESHMFLNFDTPSEVFRYISKFHTDSQRSWPRITMPEEDKESATKHSLTTEENIELQELQEQVSEKTKELNQEIKKLDRINDAEKIKELVEKSKKELSEVRERIAELKQEVEGTKMSDQQRSAKIQEIYESDTFTTKEKRDKILDLMQPFITLMITGPGGWNFDADPQAFEVEDFRRELENQVYKLIETYDPTLDKELSKYIMFNLPKRRPKIFEDNIINIPTITIDPDFDVVDKSEGNNMDSDSESAEVHSDLRQALGIEIGDQLYKSIESETKNDIITEMEKVGPSEKKLINNVKKIKKLNKKLSELEVTDKRREKIINEIEGLESANDNLLESILDNPKKKKSYRVKLQKKFAERYKDIIKSIINPTNRRSTDKDFKAFLINNKKLIIDLLAVKYKNKFPELSTSGGRMEVDQSVASQTSMDGSFVTSTTAGNQIWIKRYDIPNSEFVKLFTEGRETRYNSLLESLAMELGLDAVFQALPNELETLTSKVVETIKRDPVVKFSLGPGLDLKEFSTKELTDILGKKDENGNWIQKPIDISQQVYELERLIGKSDFDQVIDIAAFIETGLVNSKYRHKNFHPLAVAIIIKRNQQVGVDNHDVVRFKEGGVNKLKKENLTSIVDQIKEDGAIKHNGNKDENGNGVLDRQFIAVEKLALSLGYDIFTTLDPQAFNFHTRGMDISKRKLDDKRTDFDIINGKEVIRRFDKDNQSGGDKMDNSSGSYPYKIVGWEWDYDQAIFVRESDGLTDSDPVRNQGAKLVTGPFHKRYQNLLKKLKKAPSPSHDIVLDAVRLMNKGKQLFKDIDKILKEDFEGSVEEVQKQKLDKIEEKHGDEIRAANENNIKLARLISKELYNQVKDGEMSVVDAFHILQAQTGLIYGIRALTSLDFITVEGAVQYQNTGGEHINPNGNTMLDVFSLMIDALKFDSNGIVIGVNEDVNVDAELELIFEKHKQWFTTRNNMDIIDHKDNGGKNSTKNLDRLTWLIKKYPSLVADNIFSPNGKPLAETISELKTKLEIIKVRQEVEQRKKEKEIIEKEQEIIEKEQEDIPVTKLSLSEGFNDMLERVSGIDAKKKYSKVQAQILGRKKGRFQFLINPSADDFEGLLYSLIDKGKQGEADLEFFRENLLKPFNKGYNEINNKKQQVTQDYRKLRKKTPGIKRLLKKPVLRSDGSKTNLTNDHAVRVYIWDKNGIDIPGLSKRDKQALIRAVENNPILKEFAISLQEIANVKDGWVQPKLTWIIGSIMTDIVDITNEVGRQEALEVFVKNKNEIFSEENLNKIEAIYGPKFREALEEILYKMEYGKSKNANQIGRIESAWLNWVNGSTGAIMFLNTRSAALQLISAMNYLELTGPNNIINAGAAFANQPQFWKDFGRIFMSSYLRQRRGGSKIDVNMNDLYKYLEGGDFKSPKEKVEAAVAWLLQKGFTLTQIADSFAIAFGGASWYRNHVNAYIKDKKKQIEKIHKKLKNKNLSKEEREKLEEEEALLVAGIDIKVVEKIIWDQFVEKTETDQQSTRADKLSLEQTTTLGKIILAFKNTPMQYTRKIVKAMRDLKNGRGSVSGNLATIMYYGALQNLLFTGLQSALVIALYDEDEDWEDKSDKVVQSMIDNILYGFGLEGAVIVTIKNGILEFKEQEKKGWNADHAYTVLAFANLSPTIGSKLRKLYSSIKGKQINEDVIEKMDWWDPENPEWNVMANLIEALTNIPAERIMRKIQNLIVAANLEAESPEEFELVFMQKLMLVLGWNPWDVNVETQKDVVRDIIKEEKEKVKVEERNEEEQEKINIEVEKEKKEKKDINQCAKVTKSGNRCKNPVDKAGDFCASHGGKGKKCSFIKTNGKQCKLMAVNDDGRCNVPQHQVGYKK